MRMRSSRKGHKGVWNPSHRVQPGVCLLRCGVSDNRHTATEGGAADFGRLYRFEATTECVTRSEWGTGLILHSERRCDMWLLNRLRKHLPHCHEPPPRSN